MSKCPHQKIQHCPLYVGMHIANGPSCWPKNSTDPQDKGCAVEQGIEDYGRLVAQFAAQHPEEYKGCTLAEHADQAKEQRARNMRAAGLH